MGNLGLINPVAPGEITQAGMLACVSNSYGTYYPVLTKPDTASIAAGFRQVGVLAELPTVDIGRELDVVTTGIYNMPAELLFKSISGKINFTMYGVDPQMLALGMGVQPVVTCGTGSTTSGAVTTDANTGNSVLAMTATTGMTAPGTMVQVCDSADSAFSTNMARVLSVNALNITLDRPLHEKPASGATVKPVTSVMLPIGGTTPKYFSFAGLTDFPDGRVAGIFFPKVYAAKPMSFGFGSGTDPVKIPLELQALGVYDTTYGVLVGKILVWP